ncbi:sulfite reductase subunit alpha [Methyloradius palustris]|uniref:NADPH--hemoprotein reductase n=1 Tax=Methyloradius palustris TaxID=2778876 RepID=A0A8D5G0H1_9PROT|nr:sulfite reductase flavoprotein subunit alpha [Methyloradius palustris]BCM25577.1 sulfite reductase subunit alpha [Methyloradius palustris]
MNRQLLALLIVVSYFVLTIWFIRRRRLALASSTPEITNENSATLQTADTLVAFASQTGNAQQLASLTAEILAAAGLRLQVKALDQVSSSELANYRRALFIVSTTGEGDSPDNATDFVLKTMSGDANLQSLEYGLLALGDRRYTYFCGFGHTLDHWLQQSHALPLFDMVEVDNGDAGALRHWQSQLSLLADTIEAADWSAPAYQSWRLIERHLLNPGSVGGPVYHLKLEALEVHEGWQAGDIVEVGPRNSERSVAALLNALGLKHDAPANESGTPWGEWLAERFLPHSAAEIEALKQLPTSELSSSLKLLSHREYSIASLPAEGLELVVRQVRNTNGELGHGSGWLTEYASIGDKIALRVRPSPMFHPPAEPIPLILIGNGTGIAGLRAHLKASIAAGQRRHWLIFGERNAAYDAYFSDELQALQEEGVLTRLDIAYSRDQAIPIYVQDLIQQAADELRVWLDDGAAIFICGSAKGMAPEVHRVLLDIVGDHILANLTNTGRYRRDIY